MNSTQAPASTAIPLRQARSGAAGRSARARTRSSKRAVLQLAAGMVVIAGALAFLAYQGLSRNLVYYITPSELLAKGAAARGQQFTLGGQVRPGSLIKWNKRTHQVSFVLQDPKASVHVVSSVVPPAMLIDGSGAVVQGTYTHGTFLATALMVKHDGTYVAPKAGRLPKDDQYVHGK